MTRICRLSSLWLFRGQATRRIDVVQYHFNMFDRRMEQEIFPHCQQHGIGVMTYGSMGFSLLTGTFTADAKLGDNDWRSRGGNPEFDGGCLPRRISNETCDLLRI